MKNIKSYIIIAIILLFIAVIFDYIYYYRQSLKPLSYDKIYVINLARSNRWAPAKERLDKENLVYSRFEAIDGNNIAITDLETNQTILGKYAQDNKILMLKNKKYEINCTPEKIIPVKFLLIPRVFDFHPGEVGLWCSNIMIWHDAIEHNYQNIIVFEDDAIPIGRHFKIWLNNYVNSLPKGYDLAFLGDRLLSGEPQKIKNNNYVTKLHKNYHATGTFGMAYSNEGMKKLLAIAIVDHHIDSFFKDHMIINDDKSQGGFLEVYGSYNDHLTHPPLTNSEIGRYHQLTDK